MASYASSSGITGSTSSTINLTIVQAATAITWSPSTTTQQFSTALGAGVLDAIAASGPAGQSNIFAQSKGVAPGSNSDYLSGFVVNNSSFTSEMDAGPMTQFYFGRPLVTAYSTVALLNNTVDDINPAGWVSGNNTNLLGTMNWFEYKTTCTSANCTTTGRETSTAQPEMQTLAAIEPYAPANFLSSQYNFNNIAISPDSWSRPQR